MSHFTKNYRMDPYDAIAPTLPALSQKGRTVLITGGGSGIGFAIARAFVTAGAKRVIIAGRMESSLIPSKSKLESHITNNSTVIDIVAFDLGSEADISRTWSDLKAKHVEVDVLILNAASFNSSLKLSNLEALDVLRTWYGINVLGNLNMTACFLAQGQKHGKALVNVSTAAAHWTPVTLPIYGTTKAAFVQVLQAFADDVPSSDLQIVSVHPGAIFTHAAIAAGYKEDTIPWDHEDLSAGFVLWAVSKEAAFLHGRFVWANWDVDELKSMRAQVHDDLEFLRFGLKGVEHVHPQYMWKHIAEIEQENRRK